MEQIKFETWAVVELFGHTQLAGKVSEQNIAGQQFVRIDVPATQHCPTFTKYHLPSAVYGLTPVDEEYATRMAQKIAAKPINDYKHNEVIREIVEYKMAQLNPTEPLCLQENKVDYREAEHDKVFNGPNDEF